MTTYRKAILFGATILMTCAVAVAMDVIPGIRNATGAQRADQPKEHLSSDHEKRTAELRKAMPGPVDIYFDVTQVETDKPTIANAKFVDLVDVTGKDLIRFADSKGNHWLIDPDTVLSFRTRSK